MSTSKEPCFDWLRDWVSSMPSVNTATQKKNPVPTRNIPTILIRANNSADQTWKFYVQMALWLNALSAIKIPPLDIWQSVYSCWAHLAGCNAHKAVEDVIKDFRVLRWNDIDHIQTMRLQSLLALVYSCCKNRNFEKGFPHTWPLWTHATEHKPDWSLVSWVELETKQSMMLCSD